MSPLEVNINGARLSSDETAMLRNALNEYRSAMDRYRLVDPDKERRRLLSSNTGRGTMARILEKIDSSPPAVPAIDNDVAAWHESQASPYVSEPWDLHNPEDDDDGGD